MTFIIKQIDTTKRFETLRRFSATNFVSFFFRCPLCGESMRPQNARCITCGNCGYEGNTENFSGVERRAA